MPFRKIPQICCPFKPLLRPSISTSSTQLPIWSLHFHGRKNFNKKRAFEASYELEQLHRKCAPADYALYEYYKGKLEATLETQTDAFWNEVQDLKSTVRIVKSFCQSMCPYAIKQGITTKSRSQAYEILRHHSHTFPKNVWHDEFTITSLDCVKMVLATMEYHAASKARQVPELCPGQSHQKQVKKVRMDPKYCKPSDRIVYTFPWSFIKFKIFRSQFECSKHVNG